MKKNRIDVTAALIFERIPQLPLPLYFAPVQFRAEMSEAIWDLLKLVREAESLSYAEHSALFDALTEATWIAKTIEFELFTRGDAAWHDAVFLVYVVNPVAHRLLSVPEKGHRKQKLTCLYGLPTRYYSFHNHPQETIPGMPCTFYAICFQGCWFVTPMTHSIFAYILESVCAATVAFVALYSCIS